MLNVIVLAAGKGTRMKSDLPKVAHPICGVPMVEQVLRVLDRLNPKPSSIYTVVGHQKTVVIDILKHRPNVTFVEQTEQKGTGHAVLQVKPFLSQTEGDSLVVCGDTPLISTDTLSTLITTHHHEGAVGTVLTTLLDDPSGYGRVVRNADGSVAAIVEHKDATPEILKIDEINSGFYIFNTQKLFWALDQVTPANAQGEYYLPDVFKIFREHSMKVAAVITKNCNEVLGINTVEHLQAAERLMPAQPPQSRPQP